MSQEWCTIESDPGLFTELIADFGARNLQVDEIFDLTQDVQGSYGLIFLFKWRQETDPRPVLDPADVPGLFFARQVINNACATQAILSVLLNAEGVDLGDEMNNFKGFCMEFDPESRGLAIGNSDSIRLAHNAFARNDSFFLEDTKPKSGKGEAHHFIAYIPHHGSVYELDGLKSGPIHLGSFDGTEWLQVARPAIEARMARYSASETHFALMSVGKSAVSMLEAQADEMRHSLARIADEPEEDIAGRVAQLREQLLMIEAQIGEENDKLRAQKEENARRKHNFIPLIVRLLHHLARKGELKQLRVSAKERSSGTRRNETAAKQP